MLKIIYFRTKKLNLFKRNMKHMVCKITDFGEEARSIIKSALKQAKEENRAKIVGHNYDDQNFIDDAVDWYPGTDLRDIFATVFPDGTIKRGFVNLDNA